MPGAGRWPRGISGPWRSEARQARGPRPRRAWHWAPYRHSSSWGAPATPRGGRDGSSWWLMVVAWIVYGLRRLGWSLATLRRRLRRPAPWVGFLIEAPLPELPRPAVPRWQRLLGVGRPPPSLRDLRWQLRQVARDPRVQGADITDRLVAVTLVASMLPSPLFGRRPTPAPARTRAAGAEGEMSVHTRAGLALVSGLPAGHGRCRAGLAWLMLRAQGSGLG